LVLLFDDEFGSPMGGATLIFSYGNQGECIVQMGANEGSQFVSLDEDCSPVAQPCCFPVTLCITNNDVDLDFSSGVTVEFSINSSTIPGASVFPPGFPGVSLGSEGGAVTVWVCVPQDHGAGTVSVDVTVSDGLNSVSVATLDFAFDDESPCLPSTDFNSTVPLTQGTSITCPQAD
jgi:hypothetical protein